MKFSACPQGERVAIVQFLCMHVENQMMSRLKRRLRSRYTYDTNFYSWTIVKQLNKTKQCQGQIQGNYILSLSCMVYILWESWVFESKETIIVWHNCISFHLAGIIGVHSSADNNYIPVGNVHHVWTRVLRQTEWCRAGWPDLPAWVCSVRVDLPREGPVVLPSWRGFTDAYLRWLIEF